MPIDPSLWILPGMMPILALPGEMTPGQLGPSSRDFEFLSLAHTLIMSSVGMPSVMHTISGIPASSASRIASAANGGGTKIIVAFAPVFATASVTVLNTGQPSCVVPPLPGVTPPTTFFPYSGNKLGVTPPTTFVPYSAQPLAWNVPSLPVMPCTISRVLLSTKTAIVMPPPPQPQPFQPPLSSLRPPGNSIPTPSESSAPLPRSSPRAAAQSAPSRADSALPPPRLSPAG